MKFGTAIFLRLFKFYFLQLPKTFKITEKDIHILIKERYCHGNGIVFIYRILYQSPLINFLYVF